MITKVCQRWFQHRSFYRPAGEVIDTRRYEVAPIAQDGPARAFIEEHHYSRSYPVARFRFGLYEGAALVGVAVFSVPMQPKVLRPFPTDAAAELGRFVLLDAVPGNGESWFLARCLEQLRRLDLAGIVAFSDPLPRPGPSGAHLRGHVGRIYQASNATYAGRATARTLHLLPDGTVFSARAAQKIRKREQGWRYAVDQLLAAGAPPPEGDLRAWLRRVLPLVTERLRHPGNHRYLLPLDRAARVAVRRWRPISLPYPKFPDPTR